MMLQVFLQSTSAALVALALEVDSDRALDPHFRDSPEAELKYFFVRYP